MLYSINILWIDNTIIKTFCLYIMLYGNRKLSNNTLYSHGNEQHALTIHFLHGFLTVISVYARNRKS